MPISKLQFDNLLTELAEKGASDLHLMAGSSPMLKIADKLVPIGEEILTANKIQELIYPLINEDQRKVLEKEKAIVFSYTFENGLRFKINLFYQKESLAVGLRFISNKLRTIEELGLPKQIEKIVGLKSGLVIVSGPVNSGKSTTLSSIIEYFNTTSALRILTLEKPIEYIFTNKKSIISQREIGKDSPTFKEALEDAVSSSLDVVVVSSIETREEINYIFELAQQGRLVILMLSANSVLETLLKVLSFFDEEEHGHMRSILSRILQSIICQKLVPRVEDGMVAVPEILFYTESIRLAISDNKLNLLNNILRTSHNEGMITFEQSLALLARQGIILPEIALKYAEDKESLKQMISG
jgi:twitching motility protein PilT